LYVKIMHVEEHLKERILSATLPIIKHKWTLIHPSDIIISSLALLAQD